MAQTEGGLGAVEYIQHHLHNLSIGEGFWTFHIDTFFFAIRCGHKRIVDFRQRDRVVPA